MIPVVPSRLLSPAGNLKVMETVVAQIQMPRPGNLFHLVLLLKIFEYVAGSGDLDQCNGRIGVTPEFPDGIYHYMVTDDFPFFSRCLKGDF